MADALYLIHFLTVLKKNNLIEYNANADDY